MNILQILPELNSGDVERGTVDLAKYLLKNGHKSVVVSAGGAMVKDLTAAGVTHYRLPVHRKSPLSVIRSVKTLTKIVRLEQIDVIHARSRVPALIAFLVSRRTQVPFITTCHGFYSRHALSRMMGWGKLVIVASHIIGKRMRDDFGVSHQKIRLIARGVDLNEFKPRPAAADAPKEIVVGIVGRLTPIKGHSLFLKAMARVTRVLPELKVQIIGDSPKPQYKEELLALTRHLGLADSVHVKASHSSARFGVCCAHRARSVAHPFPDSLSICLKNFHVSPASDRLTRENPAAEPVPVRVR